MTIFYYIIAGMIATLLFTGSAIIVFKEGEKELICKYGQEDEKQ